MTSQFLTSRCCSGKILPVVSLFKERFIVDEKLSWKNYLFVASMLFGMFFGAGNIIFPVHLGQAAGSNVWPAIGGFILTGVGIPILAVAAIGMSGGNGLQDLASRVNKKYAMFFTCMLYLTIGPFFAIPRCATVPFSMGIAPMLGNVSPETALFGFSLLFFAIVMFFSLRPSGIVTWVGKILTPIFLIFLGSLLLVAFANPMADSIAGIVPSPEYQSGAFAKGVLEGYNTMDAMAGLAFGIIVVHSLKNLGLRSNEAIASSTVKAGILSGIIMSAIYLMIIIMGTMSMGVFPMAENGGVALSDISGYYFGAAGIFVLAGIATFACLKTAVGLVTSCSETFCQMLPAGPGYRTWACIFGAVSFLISNVGLTAIIIYAIPVLMFLYPLTITLTLLGLMGKWFNQSRYVYASVTFFTAVAAIFDLVNALPKELGEAAFITSMIEFANVYLPFFSQGFGWLIPAMAGLVIGLGLARFNGDI